MAFEVSSVPSSLTTMQGYPRRSAIRSNSLATRMAGDRVVNHRGQAFPAEVIDDTEDAKAPAIHQGVRGKVQGPENHESDMENKVLLKDSTDRRNCVISRDRYCLAGAFCAEFIL